MEPAVDPKAFEIEPAWIGGPLRVKGTGSGKKSHYVCSACLAPVSGVYRVKRGFSEAATWLCAACRRLAVPKQRQPAGLRLPSSGQALQS
jgi:hypothetical protein